MLVFFVSVVERGILLGSVNVVWGLDSGCEGGTHFRGGFAVCVHFMLILFQPTYILNN